jgi:hypothetical protein
LHLQSEELNCLGVYLGALYSAHVYIAAKTHEYANSDRTRGEHAHITSTGDPNTNCYLGAHPDTIEFRSAHRYTAYRDTYAYGHARPHGYADANRHISANEHAVADEYADSSLSLS